MSSDRPYHHGDLRAALVAEGVAQLKQGAVEDLSLRAVARAAGVSATAVYRHFPDKQALLYAICEQTAADLAKAQAAAVAGAMDPRQAYAAAGRTYVRFALANPAAFRLMTATRDPNAGPATMDRNIAHVLGSLRPVLKTLAPNLDEAALRVAAIHAWSMAHGMAMLMLDGLIPADERLIETLRPGGSPFGEGAAPKSPPD